MQVYVYTPTTHTRKHTQWRWRALGLKGYAPAMKFSLSHNQVNRHIYSNR